MKLKILTLGVGLALAAGAAAVAEPGQRRVEDRVVIMSGPGGHGGMDANKDGSISREEFRAMHDRMFDKLDADRDGKLEDGEMLHRAGPDGERFEMRIGPGGHGAGRPGPHGGPDGDVRIVRHGPGGDGLDANKDGKVSLEEFTAPMREHFQEADKNRNGFLDGDEMKGEHRVMFRHERREESPRQ